MQRRFPLAVIGLALLASCDQFQATADRAMATLQGKTPPAPSGGAPQAGGASSGTPAKPPPVVPDTGCPDAVEGRAAGAESPEAALSCFRRAIAAESAPLLLRVTCQGRTPASCKQSDATLREAEKAMADLKKTPWTSVLGRWDEGKAVVFAVDTRPGEKIVSTVVTCKIAEGNRWAACEIGETSRDAAAQKAK